MTARNLAKNDSGAVRRGQPEINAWVVIRPVAMRAAWSCLFEATRLFDADLACGAGRGAPHAVKDYFSANTWIVPPCGTSRY